MSAILTEGPSIRHAIQRWSVPKYGWTDGWIGSWLEPYHTSTDSWKTFFLHNAANSQTHEQTNLPTNVDHNNTPQLCVNEQAALRPLSTNMVWDLKCDYVTPFLSWCICPRIVCICTHTEILGWILWNVWFILCYYWAGPKSLNPIRDIWSTQPLGKKMFHHYGLFVSGIDSTDGLYNVEQPSELEIATPGQSR